jgi:undecaprenyl-diphosphatase
MPFITNRSYLIVLPFLALFCIKEKKKALGIVNLALFSILPVDALGKAFKNLTRRPRPWRVLVEHVNLLVACGSRPSSLPSIHAVTFSAFAPPFFVMTRNHLTYVFACLAALLCLSRVFVGVQYPSSVVIGAILGSRVSLYVLRLYRWAEKKFRDNPYMAILLISLLAFSLFRIYYILNGPLDLSPDEAQYWDWSRRPDWSYYSKGPMIAYLIALGTSLFGDTVLGVRFLAVVFSALSSIVLYALGRELSNKIVGASSALLFQVIPLYTTFGVIFTIDSPFVFFWVLSLYLFYKATERQNLTANRRMLDAEQNNGVSCAEPLDSRKTQASTRYWVLLGFAIGLGLLTKYIMVFFIGCAFLFLVFSERGRKILRTSSPYLSLLISLFIFSPVIFWNARNGWITVKHTAGQAHIAEGLRISLYSLLDFVGSQLGVITPILFILLIIALCRRDDGQKRAFLLWFSLPVIVFFTLKSIQGKVQANWAMTGYITGIIAFSEVFIIPWKRHSRRVKSLIIGAITLSLLVSSVAFYPSKFHIPLKLDPSARLRGWKELGKTISVIEADTHKKGNVFIFSDSYQTSSELAFYVKVHPVTYCANLGRRMNQYDLWPDFSNRIHDYGIFVTIGDTQLYPMIRDAFHGCEKRLLKVYEEDRVLREYSIFVCSDFKGMPQQPIGSF